MTMPSGGYTRQNRRSREDRLAARAERGGSDGGSTPPIPPDLPTPPTQFPVTPAELRNFETHKALSAAMLPFMSPEDRRNASQALGIQDANIPPPPTRITSSERARYLSSARGEETLAALDYVRNLRGKSKDEMGPGYAFLVEAASELRRLGGVGGQMSRASYVEFVNVIDDIINRMKSQEETAPYLPLVERFANPAFSAGPLMNVGQTNRGYKFGAPNPRLFG